MENAISATPAPELDRSFFGHPRGLKYLTAMEGLERFSYFGMQALLVLYMTGRLFQPGVADHVIGFAALRTGVEAVFGPLTLQALALQIFGLYSGLVYLLPLVGGYIGDQFLGRRRSVVWGLVCMAVGHGLMSFEQTFLFALSTLLIGSALLKGNVAAQVGGLYGDGDRRSDEAFSIFLLASNTGAVVAPLICGTLGELYGWRYGFDVAAVVVLIGLAVYLKSGQSLQDPPLRRRSGARPALAQADRARIALMIALALAAALFWVAQSQIWSAYPVWVRDRVDRHIFGLDIPVTWFQSVDSLGTIVFGPVVIWLWARQQARGDAPSDVTKIVCGALGFAGAEALLAAGELAAGAHKVHVIWPLSFHILSAIGWLYIAPSILALAARLAPQSLRATGVSSYYVSVFVGATISGTLGRLFGVVPNAAFWALHAGFAAACGAAMLCLAFPIRRVLKAMAASAS